jgi:hypothetical protein
MSLFFKVYKLTLLLLTCLCFSLANANEVERVRDIANSKPFFEENKTATDLAQDFLLDADVTEGWNDDKDFFISIGASIFAEADPATNPNFLNIRALKSFEANISAKGNIISYIRTKMSAEDIVTVPSSGLSTEFDDKKYNIELKLQGKINKFRKAAINYDKTLSSNFNNIDNISISAVIAIPLPEFVSKFNITIDASGNEKVKALKNAEKELLALQTEIKELKDLAKKLQEQVSQENTSSVKTLSSMTLVGAFQVAHFESFVDGQYEIAVIKIWSPKQEQRALAMMKGIPINLAPGNLSVKEYIKSTNWASAIGGRKFIDNKGEFFLFGIGATPIKGKSSAQMRTAKGRAEMFAQKELAIALKGDVALSREAKTKLQEIIKSDGSTENQVTSSFAENISQKLENVEIQGASKRYSDIVTHPITNQKMYVAVYSLSVSSTQNARAMEASQYAASVYMIKENEFSKGVKVGYDKSIDETKKDTTSFEKAKNESYKQSNETLKTKEQPSAKSNSSRSKLTVVSVNVTGIGFNLKDAIKDGLLQAISQVNGLQMSSQTTSAMASFETIKDGNETFASSSSFQEEIKQKTKGVIQSWKIISTGKSQSGKMFQAKIDVNVSKLELSSELKRMRFVVSPIKISKSIDDLSIAKKFATTFNSNLRSMLVKSNRFALLDRENSRELNKEIDVIKGSNVRVEELAKLGNKVGADYIIIASLQKLNNKTIKQKLMGETISSKEINADLAISVIDIATSQIIFSDNMILSQAGGSLSKFTKIISNRLSRKITDTFFPAKLIALKDNKMTVDQGSSFFNKKSKYNIIKLGARVVDQTTNEFSGRVEEVIGEASFLEGTGKQSTLKIDKLSKNKKLLNINGSIIIRPIFKALPSASDIAKAKIKKIKSNNNKMMNKINKDKDW